MREPNPNCENCDGKGKVPALSMDPHGDGMHDCFCVFDRQEEAMALEDLDIIQRARAFAEEWHGDQLYGEHPYIYHPEKARSVLLWMGDDQPEHHAAMLLHDVIEDTRCPYRQVLDGFGRTVAELVWAVTDERGRTRFESHQKTYPKLVGLKGAIIIKLADRIANVEQCRKAPGGAQKLRMYAEEQMEFRSALMPHGGPGSAWVYLDQILKGEAPLREGA